MDSETEVKETEPIKQLITADMDNDKEKDFEGTHQKIETATSTSVVGNKETKNVEIIGKEENAVKTNTGQDESKELIAEIQGEINDSDKNIVKSVANKIENEIETNIEKKEVKEIIEQKVNDKTDKGEVTNDPPIMVAATKITKETHDEMKIEKGRVPVVEPEFVQEHIEPLGSLQDVQDGIVDAAKSITQKVLDKIENKIEEKVKEEESKEIISAEDKCIKDIDSSFATEPDEKVEEKQLKEEICQESAIEKERIPVFEPEFVQEHIEPLGSIQEISDSFMDTAKSITQKVVEKIENKVEERIAEEESKDFNDGKKATQKETISPDGPKPEIKSYDLKAVEQTLDDNKIPVDEPMFNQVSIKNVESLQDVKEDIVEAAKSVVKQVITKIDNEITNKVEKAEKSEIIDEPVAFKEEKIETFQAVLQSDTNTAEQKGVANDQESENSKQNSDNTLEHECAYDSDIIEKLKAPSFTQLRAESYKEDTAEELKNKTVSDEDEIAVQEVNGEDYYWITVGSFVVAILAVASSLLYYYFQ